MPPTARIIVITALASSVITTVVFWCLQSGLREPELANSPQVTEATVASPQTTKAASAQSPKLNATRKTRTVRRPILPSANPEELDREFANYSRNRVGKFQTLYLTTLPPDVRVKHFLKNFAGMIDDRQSLQIEKIVLAYDGEFEELLRARNQLMFHRRTETEIPQKLLELRIEMADLVMKIRSRAIRTVLTKEQRELFRLNLKAKQTGPG